MSPRPALGATASAQLRKFIARYTPGVAEIANGVLHRMRTRLPGAFELIYDNYNGLVIGFSPTEKPKDAAFSIVLYPKWVTLFFLKGARLPDPDRVFQGPGSIVRSIRIENPAILDKPQVKSLMERALADANWIPAKGRRGKLIIKAVVAKQRPRRP